MTTNSDESQMSAEEIPRAASEAIDLFAMLIRQAGNNIVDADLNDIFLAARHAHMLTFLMFRGYSFNPELDESKIQLLQTTNDQFRGLLLNAQQCMHAPHWLEKMLYHKEVLQCLIDGDREKLHQLLRIP